LFRRATIPRRRPGLVDADTDTERVTLADTLLRASVSLVRGEFEPFGPASGRLVDTWPAFEITKPELELCLGEALDRGFIQPIHARAKVLRHSQSTQSGRPEQELCRCKILHLQQPFDALLIVRLNTLTRKIAVPELQLRDFKSLLRLRKCLLEGAIDDARPSLLLPKGHRPGIRRRPGAEPYVPEILRFVGETPTRKTVRQRRGVSAERSRPDGQQQERTHEPPHLHVARVGEQD
jgi:hypothetical protein